MGDIPVFVQVFAGEAIDMDNFNSTAGPDGDARARNVANDPYAAAKFFKVIIDLLLSKVFGIDATGFRVSSKRGILGKIRAYFGVVEAQGRGTLHLHMLMWLCGAPTSDEMRELLQQAGFRDRIAAFIRANIRAHSRPPRPDDAAYDRQYSDLERRVVRASQVHTCKKETCLILTRDGKRKCKRRAPMAISIAGVLRL